jgi:hypothetical protein
MKTTGYEKLCVTVILCITTNENKLLLYVNSEQKDSARRKLFQRCNSSGLNKYMDDITVNGRMACMCVGTFPISPKESEIG